jgi:thiol-activated cytolysin
MSKVLKPKVVVSKAAPKIVFKKKSALSDLTVVKRPEFKFKLRPNPVLDKRDITLAGGGKVAVTARRSVSNYGNIVPDPNYSQQMRNDNWSCSTEKWSGEIHTQETAILNRNFEEIYPGAIFDYESIANGTYKTLPYKRKPLGITITDHRHQIVKVNVDNPTYGDVMTATGKIINSQIGNGAARTYGQRFHVLSEEDLFIRTGGSGYFLGFGGSHQVDYKSNSKSNKYFVEIIQEYFSIKVNNTVFEPSDFFVMKSEEPNNSKALDETKVDPNWVYVRSVVYGRMLQLMFESDESFESVGLDIEAHADFLFAGGEGNFNSKQKNVLKNTSVKVVAIGGDPVYSAQLLNADSLKDLKTRLDNYFDGRKDEMPIGYSLSTLDQEIVGAQLMSNFTSRSCAPRANKYAVEWDTVTCLREDDGGGGEQIKAMVRVRCLDGGGKDILDIDKINEGVLNAIKVKANGLAIPIPFTFSKGNDDSPLNLTQGETYTLNKKLTFKVNPNDDNAKIAIRADVIEFDDFGDDNFTDGEWQMKIGEIGASRTVKLVCSHDLSRIEFKFSIYPVFD